jgi:hypothetical protein
MRVPTKLLPIDANEMTRSKDGSFRLQMERRDLMMVGVFVGFAKILLRFLVKGLLAAQ